jgi:ABC-2 type transport system permease protein
MNTTVATLTWHSLVGRRRAILLMVLPVVLLALAVVIRVFEGQDADNAVTLLGRFSLGFLIPLLCLIAGTGAIGPEIDDGSIVYVLAKPISRYTIVLSKLAVAITVAIIFGALPTVVAGFVMAGGQAHVAIAYGIGALVAGLAYSALFLLLAIVTRSAVVFGLLYVLVWESVVGGYVPGAQALSIQQWALAITAKVVGARADELDVTSAVDLPIAIILLLVVAAGGTAYAGHRLRSLRLTGDE